MPSLTYVPSNSSEKYVQIAVCFGITFVIREVIASILFVKIVML